MKQQISLVLVDVRSGHNVGSLIRTADGLGVQRIYLCGITPHPRVHNDPRPEHVIRSNTKEIHKTALGAENSVPYEYHEDTESLLQSIKKRGFMIYCIENNVPNAKDINLVETEAKIALVLGSETAGLTPDQLRLADQIVEIPMQGSKNSLNVSVAGGIALYALIQRRD